MKSRGIILISLLLSVLMVIGCTAKEAEEIEEILELEEEVFELEEEVFELEEEVVELPMQRIGSDEYGYLSVPQDWVSFVDLNVNDSIQYSNILGTSIISLNIFDTSTVPEEEQEGFTAEMAASNIWYNLDASGVEDIEGAIVELGGREAYQVYGYFLSEDHNLPSIIVTWIIEDDDENYHYVAAEAALEDIVDVLGYVEDSYSFKE